MCLTLTHTTIQPWQPTHRCLISGLRNCLSLVKVTIKRKYDALNRAVLRELMRRKEIDCESCLNEILMWTLLDLGNVWISSSVVTHRVWAIVVKRSLCLKARKSWRKLVNRWCVAPPKWRKPLAATLCWTANSYFSFTKMKPNFRMLRNWKHYCNKVKWFVNNLKHTVNYNHKHWGQERQVTLIRKCCLRSWKLHKNPVAPQNNPKHKLIILMYVK